MTHPYEDRPPAPARTPSKAPRILILSGAVLLVLAVVAGVLSVLRFVDVLPLDVLGADGEPGRAVVGVVEAPGSGEMALEPGDHVVWLVRSANAGHSGPSGELVVRGQDGQDVDVVSGAGVSGAVERGGRDAHTVAGFTVPEQGVYTLEVPEQGDGRVTAIVTTDTGVPTLMTDIAGTLGLAFLAVGLGLAGIGLLVGGAITASSQRSRALRVGTHP